VGRGGWVGRENGDIPARTGAATQATRGQCSADSWCPSPERVSALSLPRLFVLVQLPYRSPKVVIQQQVPTVARGGRDRCVRAVSFAADSCRMLSRAAYTVHVGQDRRRMDRAAACARWTARSVGWSTSTRGDGSRLAAFPTHARATYGRVRGQSDRPAGDQDEGVNPTGTLDNSEFEYSRSITDACSGVLVLVQYPSLREVEGSQCIVTSI
jgi:hypothetical protein